MADLSENRSTANLRLQVQGRCASMIFSIRPRHPCRQRAWLSRLKSTASCGSAACHVSRPSAPLLRISWSPISTGPFQTHGPIAAPIAVVSKRRARPCCRSALAFATLGCIGTAGRRGARTAGPRRLVNSRGWGSQSRRSRRNDRPKGADVGAMEAQTSAKAARRARIAGNANSQSR